MAEYTSHIDLLSFTELLQMLYIICMYILYMYSTPLFAYLVPKFARCAKNQGGLLERKWNKSTVQNT